MKTRNWIITATAAIVMVALVALSPMVFAQGQGPGPGATPSTGGQCTQEMMGQCAGHGAGHGAMMGQGQSLVAIAAEVLGIEQADLVARLQDGTTIAALAAERNVSIEQIVERFVAAHTEHLSAQVAAGNLTQEQADAMLATMQEHVTTRLNEAWSPRGTGMGMGFVDADGDGVCDHAGSGMMQGHGGGMMQGHQGGMMQGHQGGMMHGHGAGHGGQ